MQDPIDAPDLDVSSDDADPTPPTPSWRRPLLITSGLGLLALGAWLNADHLGLDADTDDRFVGLLEQAPEDEEEPPTDKAEHRHRGEEGKMGRPSTKSKSGLYAMKGPADAVPQMARSFDPNTAAHQSGILGVMQQQGGHFIASPYGGAFAVGDDEDVWGGLTGTEVGQAYGVGGLGLVGTGRGGGGVGVGGEEFDGGQNAGYRRNAGGERYQEVAPNVFIPTGRDAKSTFSIDVDTASYANTRRYLLESHQLPPSEAVRTEELINYFDYDYAAPSGDGAPFSVTTEVGPSPWSKRNRLVHIGIQGMVPERDEIPPRNLVFLLDVSGSMSASDKLPLVKHGLASLTEQLGPEDRVSIVVYAGAAGAVLPPTAGSDRQRILAALDQLDSGGSTNGAEGIELAYQLAEQTFDEDGINRVILATDGDFNVGVSDHDALVKLIETKRESGVFLSVLGVGTGNLNDHMMEQIADKGNGNYAYIDGVAEARKVLVEEAGSMLDTIAKDVKIQVEFDPDQVAKHRLVGYENRMLAHRDFDDDSKDAGEIGAGHTVTAIYEIVPQSDAKTDAELMSLSLRYKQPDGHRSRKLTAPVSFADRSWTQTSNDYRFSAAVASFAEALRGTQDDLRYAEILELAEGALGDDPNCYRHQFLDLVWEAATVSGEKLAKPDSACTPSDTRPPERVLTKVIVEDTLDILQPEPPQVLVEEIVIHEHDQAQVEWMSFMLEVLRLLPPFLALPMFIMALRRR